MSFFVSESGPKVYLRTISLLILTCLLCASVVAQQAEQTSAVVPRPLITQAIDETQLTTLKGNVHPLARPQFDLGTAPATLPMERMLLVLRRSADQETSLRTLLDNLQDKNSPNYHKWLTPEQFGAQFGPTDSDMQTITSWLQSHGFQVGTTKGRTVLEFSGSASQVAETFHTSIHKYLVNGEQHWANATDPQIPTALVPAIRGVLTMHNFLSKPASHLVKEPMLAQVVTGKGGNPEVTFPQSGGASINALAPQDYAVIYNINPTYGAYTGYGKTIGVVGRSNLYNGGEDVTGFWGEIGTGNNNFGRSAPEITVNGPDPGDAGGGEEAEATLDTTWSGAVAPGANIDLVVSGSTNTTDGIDLSELYIVENNSADIMTESFSACEYFSSDAQIAGINALAEQAAAQGISYFVSTGDSGAEGCDDPSTPPAQYPISVNALASTPFTTAVGGTMFNENGNQSKYWASTAPISETALSYIPENVWNESSSTNGLWAGSGGASAGNINDPIANPPYPPGSPGMTSGVAKPSWQAGTGLNIPADGVRDLPDVSLTAAGHDPYLLCLEASCVPSSQGYISVYFISGTSASAPSFAGIMALIDQSMGGRQGQANYVLYPLAAAQAGSGIYPSQCNGSNTSAFPGSTCVFNDVTVGNNVVPGETGSSYQAGAGYDLASGLGSVNVANLVTNWSTVKFNATTTTFKLNNGVSAISITHGQSVAMSAGVTGNSGTPTGSVVLYTSNGLAPSTLDQYPLSAGQASGTTNSLPGSGASPYNVWAHYGGDGKFASSDSNQISVTVSAEPSTTTLSSEITTTSGGALASPYPFGSLVFVRADVKGNSGYGTPTGAVTFTDTFGPLPSMNPQVNPPVGVVSNPPLNSEGNTSIGDGIISFDAGNHTISANYAGDGSFSASSSSSSVSFTIQPGFAIVSGLAPITITAPGGTGTTSVGIIASSNFTTPITFTCSGLTTGMTCVSSTATGQGPTTVVNTTIAVNTTATQAADLRPQGRSYYFAALMSGLPLAGIFFVASPRRRRWSTLFGMMLLATLVMVPGCGGGGGGSSTHKLSGTPAGTYTVMLTATSGSVTQSGTFTVVVQ